MLHEGSVPISLASPGSTTAVWPTAVSHIWLSLHHVYLVHDSSHVVFVPLWQECRYFPNAVSYLVFLDNHISFSGPWQTSQQLSPEHGSPNWGLWVVQLEFPCLLSLYAHWSLSEKLADVLLLGPNPWQSHQRKGRLIMPHSLKSKSIVVGAPWWQEPEAAGSDGCWCSTQLLLVI